MDSKLSDKIYFILIGLIVGQLPVHAYLDPGTGSLVLQIVLAAFAGVAYWCKIQWNNIKGFFNKIWKKK